MDTQENEMPYSHVSEKRIKKIMGHLKLVGYSPSEFKLGRKGCSKTSIIEKTPVQKTTINFECGRRPDLVLLKIELNAPDCPQRMLSRISNAINRSLQISNFSWKVLDGYDSGKKEMIQITIKSAYMGKYSAESFNSFVESFKRDQEYTWAVLDKFRHSPI